VTIVAFRCHPTTRYPLAATPRMAACGLLAACSLQSLIVLVRRSLLLRRLPLDWLFTSRLSDCHDPFRNVPSLSFLFPFVGIAGSNYFPFATNDLRLLELKTPLTPLPTNDATGFEANRGSEIDPDIGFGP
jgi:hypothetical protein